MRDYKFRAWDGEAEMMLDSNELDQSTLGHLKRANEINWHIMQYTGLKDKNGKEIYEGDIIKFSREQGYTHFRKGSVASIAWFGFRYVGFGFDENCSLTTKKSKELEVIGNIYENSELLSKEE